MANPTTNYGWVLPTPTDLVTDLPADFDVALQGVDTRLKALNPSTTLGDVQYASATANTNTRLGIGTSGQVLTVSGGVPTWATPAGGGGFTSIATGSLSGTTTTISSISQSYRHLYLLIRGPQLSGTAALPCFRLNGDSGSVYANFRITLDSTVVNSSGALTFIRSSGSNIPTSANSRALILQVENYTQTNQVKAITSRYMNEANGGDACNVVWSNYNSTSAITSIGITTDTGTPTFTAGTYTLFGVN